MIIMTVYVFLVYYLYVLLYSKNIIRTYLCDREVNGIFVSHIFCLVDCLIDSWCVGDGALSIDSVHAPVTLAAVIFQL